MYTIKFDFQQEGIEPITLENIAPGQSLLEVALINNIDLHHNCGGVCTCSTCHLYVKSGGDYLEEKSKREEDVLKKAFQPMVNSRLSCQCLLMEGSGTIELNVPDQTKV
jgi:ferredoxin, 2Fe-2S